MDRLKTLDEVAYDIASYEHVLVLHMSFIQSELLKSFQMYKIGNDDYMSLITQQRLSGIRDK